MQAFSEVETGGRRPKKTVDDTRIEKVMHPHAVWCDAKMLAATSYLAMSEVSEMA